MSIIMHIHRQGERCKRPAIITTPASYIRGGDIIGRGDWNLSYSYPAKAYRVWSQYTDTPDVYEFTNYNCAAAKLVELGR